MKRAKRESGNTAIASLGQLAVMAALVTTMAYFPLGLGLVFLVRLAGVGFETLITFGGSLIARNSERPLSTQSGH